MIILNNFYCNSHMNFPFRTISNTIAVFSDVNPIGIKREYHMLKLRKQIPPSYLQRILSRGTKKIKVIYFKYSPSKNFLIRKFD